MTESLANEWYVVVIVVVWLRVVFAHGWIQISRPGSSRVQELLSLNVQWISSWWVYEVDITQLHSRKTLGRWSSENIYTILRILWLSLPPKIWWFSPADKPCPRRSATLFEMVVLWGFSNFHDYFRWFCRENILDSLWCLCQLIVFRRTVTCLQVVTSHSLAKKRVARW